jgi:hypothetical protein
MLMPVYRMVLTDEAEWGPLERLAEALSTSDWPRLDPDDFLYMGREISEDGHPTVHLCKAIDTRRHLNLDEEGHAYWYCGPVPGEEGSNEIDTPCVYELTPTLEAAIQHVRS